MEMLDVLALVPARSGSKGFPGKNTALLSGHPLLAYSVSEGVRSSLVNRVICSTDSSDIAAIAKMYGAEVPFLRPPEFAADHSTDLDVVRHDIDWLKLLD